MTEHLCPMSEVQTYDVLNEAVAGWAKTQAAAMRRAVGSLSLKDKHALRKQAWAEAKDPTYKPLQRSIGFGLRKDYGQVSRINFRFSRQGIFVEHGVGKGRPVRSAKGNPRPFITPVLSPALDVLADLLAENYADAAGGSIKFFIPGIISRRVKIQVNG